MYGETGSWICRCVYNILWLDAERGAEVINAIMRLELRWTVDMRRSTSHGHTGTVRARARCTSIAHARQIIVRS